MKSKKPTLEIVLRASDQLGQAIGRFRAKAELSQSNLAKNAGVRQATISKVEKGVGTTEIQTVFSICAALGLELVLRSRNPQDDEFRPEKIF
jgi:HTH-type transcriptional regulator / antitoxin HipB